MGEFFQIFCSLLWPSKNGSQKNCSIGMSVVSDYLCIGLLGEGGVCQVSSLFKSYYFPLATSAQAGFFTVCKSFSEYLPAPCPLGSVGWPSTLSWEAGGRLACGMWALGCSGSSGQCQLLPLLGTAASRVRKRASSSSESHCRNTACSSLGQWRGVSQGCWWRSWGVFPSPTPSLS